MGNKKESKRKYNLGQHHLLRRRGARKFWTGWLRGREVSLGTADRADAVRRLDELARGQDSCGTEAGSSPDTSAPLTDLALKFAVYCQPPRHTPKTADSYSRKLANLIAHLERTGVVRTDQVTFPVMSAYMRARADAGAGAATINRDITAVRQMFVFGVRQGLISRDPFDDPGFRSLKLREPRPKPNAVTLSPEQIDKFLALAGSACPRAYAKLFEGVAGSAMRIDEARHISSDDIDCERGLLIITPKEGWTTKSYRYRTVPITGNTATALKEFVSLQGTVALDDRSVWMQLEIARLAAGLPKFSMHDLRRAWASAVHHNGASLKQVSVWLGHADVATTERYIRVFDQPSSGHEFLPR